MLIILTNLDSNCVNHLRSFALKSIREIGNIKSQRMWKEYKKPKSKV